METYLLVAIVGVGIALLIIAFIKHKMEWFVNYVLRVVLGVVGIYTINSILRMNAIDCFVGLNSFNVFMVAILGIPGFALVYSLGIYFMLKA